MSNMTVQRQRPSCTDKAGQTNCGLVLVTGEQNIERRVIQNLSFSQSWNGCIRQMQHRTDAESLPLRKGNSQNECHHNGYISNRPCTRTSTDHDHARSDSGLSKSLDTQIPQENGERPRSADKLRNDRLSSLGHSNKELSNDRHSNHKHNNGGLSTNDRLSNDSDKTRLSTNNDDNNLTSAGSNSDSFEPEEEYVLLDRCYTLPRSLKTQCLPHYLSMTDLKYNSLHSPKINNDVVAAFSKYAKCVPHGKPRKTLKSISVNETNLDAVNLDGRGFPWAKRSLKRIYENIGDFLKPKLVGTKFSFVRELNIDGESVDFRNDSEITHCVTNGNPFNSWHSNYNNPNGIRMRSKSLGELPGFGEQDDDDELDFSTGSNSGNENSDVDGDDFGFLSHSYIHSSPAMPKTKSLLASHRILPKRWRSKPRNSTAGQCLWSPEGNCIWRNVNGQKTILKPISVLQLSEAERLTLQKIVLKKIQSFDLGCTVNVPKEHRKSGRRGKQLLSVKRSKSANLSDLIHNMDRENDKGKHDSGYVFGISLKKCIANDMELQQERNSGIGAVEKTKSSDVILHRHPNGSLENCTQNGSSLEDCQKRYASCDSLSESESSRNTSPCQVDALLLSDNRINTNNVQSSVSMNCTGTPQVPYIVKACFQHIETYGLRVLGIFRIGSSKKRTKQLRDEFDSGRDVNFNESHNPHDVGAVLKEYFRDLPEPLLTRDLYSPFIAARGLSDVEKQTEVIRMLISLLPVPNRDTLWALLQFLSKVKEHSIDSIDEFGQTLPGNKMDSHNLATLFGPNILHKAKVTEKRFTVDSVERAGERKKVIEVVKALIDFHQTYFQLPAALLDAILQMLLESDPEATEQILKRITAENNGIEPNPDTSTSLDNDNEASLENSVGSESNLLRTNTNNHDLRPTLRGAKSAETLTPTFRPKSFHASEGEREKDINKRKSDINSAIERPKFHLLIENSPSPPEVRSATGRTQLASVSSDSSSPELLRPHSVHAEGPHPVLYCTPKTLSIPHPEFMRPLSDSSRSNKSPPRADSYAPSGFGTSKLGLSSKMASSIQRPLDLNRSSYEDENEWQKHRWRQWDNVTARKPSEGFEHETLV